MFDMAEVHVLIVAAVVATSIFHITKVTLGRSDMPLIPTSDDLVLG